MYINVFNFLKNKPCRHHKHYLLPWHCLFIAHMEDEPGEDLPYWDWTVDGIVVNDTLVF